MYYRIYSKCPYFWLIEQDWDELFQAQFKLGLLKEALPTKVPLKK